MDGVIKRIDVSLIWGDKPGSAVGWYLNEGIPLPRVGETLESSGYKDQSPKTGTIYSVEHKIDTQNRTHKVSIYFK